MKANEIILRQNRVVYTLMILLAGMGLVWSFWQHQHNADSAAPTQTVPAAERPAAHSAGPSR